MSDFCRTHRERHSKPCAYQQLEQAEADKARLQEVLQAKQKELDTERVMRVTAQDAIAIHWVPLLDKLQARVEELQTQRDGWERTNTVNLHNLAELRRGYLALGARLKRAVEALKRLCDSYSNCEGVCESPDDPTCDWCNARAAMDHAKQEGK